MPLVENLQSSVDPLVLGQSPQGKGGFKSPKSKLNELCQSLKFSSPIYQKSEDDMVITVSITIEGQEVHYPYTSEQTMSTKKYIKQCEENAAEIAFTELTKLYGTCISNTPPQRTHEQSGKQLYIAG